MRVGSESSVDARTAAFQHPSGFPMSTLSVKVSTSASQTLRSLGSNSGGLVYVTVNASSQGNTHLLRPSFTSAPLTATLVTVRAKSPVRCPERCDSANAPGTGTCCGSIDLVKVSVSSPWCAVGGESSSSVGVVLVDVSVGPWLVTVCLSRFAARLPAGSINGLLPAV